MATRKTYICLKCNDIPEFDTYVEAWRHCREIHSGELFLDTRVRIKKG